MNLYFVITHEMKVVESYGETTGSGGSFPIYGLGYHYEFVFAATPGQAKYTFIKNQKWPDDCEFADIARCTCLQKNVDRERGIVDWRDPLVEIPCPTCGDEYTRPGERVDSFKCRNCDSQIVLQEPTP